MRVGLDTGWIPIDLVSPLTASGGAAYRRIDQCLMMRGGFLGATGRIVFTTLPVGYRIGIAQQVSTFVRGSNADASKGGNMILYPDGRLQLGATEAIVATDTCSIMLTVAL